MKKKRVYTMNTWRGIKVEKNKTCLECGIIFPRNPQNTKVFNRQKFCNRKCWGKNFMGENHPQYRKDKIRKCIDCEGEIERHTKARCRRCQNKYQTGKKHPTYIHGLYIKGNVEGKKLGKRLSQNNRRLKTKGTFTKDEWTEVLKTYKHRCAKCKIHNKIKKMTIDHIIPVSKGGENIKSNIQPLCSNCNCSKGAKLQVPLVHES